MRKLLQWAVIVASVLLLSWFYDYHQLIGKSPQSFHHWRQSDCASLTQNFHEQDLPFWQPQTHGLVSDSGTTGKNAPSELALYYWTIAQFYDGSDNDENLLRGVNTFLFLAGIAAFIYALFLISQSLLWSILLGLLLFTSPILNYYGNSFLTNAPSFGMALTALAFFTAYLKKRQVKFWWWATLFFFLAGALKLPGLFLFFAIGALVILHPSGIQKLNWQQYLVSALVILIPLVAWVIYANRYNELHNTVYFSTTIFPPWEFTWPELRFFVTEMRKMWWGEHFHPYTFIGFVLLLLFLLFKRKQLSRSWRIILIYLLIGLALYTVLQFYTFMSHDYYTVNMFMLAALLLLLFTDYIKNRYPNLLHRPLPLILLALILAGNAYYAKQRLDFRYAEFPNEFYHQHPLLYSGGSEWLSEIGVDKSDTIIFIKDDSHTSLYLLGRHGWTTHKMAFKDTSRTIRFNQSAEGIERSIENGAEYLVVHGLQTLYENVYLQGFINHLKGRQKELFVFDLLDTTTNFELPERQLLKRYFFDFDNPDTTDNITRHIVKDSAISGEYVLKAQENDEFLAARELHDLEAGMLIEVTVWIKTHPDAKVVPVISSNEPGLAFEQRTKIIKESGPWRKLKQQLLITPEVAQKGARVFLWNPEKRKAWFDDMEVLVYDKNPMQGE